MSTPVMQARPAISRISCLPPGFGSAMSTDRQPSIASWSCGSALPSFRPVLGVDHAVIHRLLLLLEQILEDELAPSAAACVHQRATLVELSQLDGCEPELFGQGRHGSDRAVVVARQKDDPVPALDDRIASQGGRNQAIETFHELGAGERLRDDGGGQKTVQLFKGN